MPTSAEWVSAGAPPPESAPTPTPEPVGSAPTPSPAGTGSVPGSPATSPAGSPAAGDATVEEIEAWLDAEGKTKAKWPLTATVPWKQRGETGRASIKELQENFLYRRDYDRLVREHRQKTTDLDRKDREYQLRQVEYETRQKILDDRLAEYQAKLGDVEGLQKLLQDQDRLQNDPEYRKLHEKGIAYDIDQARAATEAQLETHDYAVSVTDEAADFIAQSAGHYPGVDPDDVRQALSRALLSGELTIPDPNKGERVNPNDPRQFSAWTVTRFFQEAKTKLDRVVSPLSKENAELRQRLDALEAASKNGAVVAGLRHVGAPATGGPPAPRTAIPPASGMDPPKPGETIDERTRNWARRR